MKKNRKIDNYMHKKKSALVTKLFFQVPVFGTVKGPRAVIRSSFFDVHVYPSKQKD